MIQAARPASVHAVVGVVFTLLTPSGLANGQANPSSASSASHPSAAPEEHPLCADCSAEKSGRRETAPYNLATAKRLTGDLFGLRAAAEDAGFTFAPRLITVYEQNFRGGANTHNAHEIAGKWFYNAELDFGKMGVMPGATFFFRAIQTFNAGIGADVGSLVPPFFSAGSGGDHFFGDLNCILVDKWWYRQRLLDDRLEFRLGKLLNILDLHDRSPYAGSYANSFQNRALNHNLTLPVRKGIGAFVKVWPTDWLYLQASAIDPDQGATRTGFDTAFHGPARFLGNWEFGLTPKWMTPDGGLSGNYRFGWWLDPEPRTIFEDANRGVSSDHRRTGDVGFYVNFDQMIWKEDCDPADHQGLGAFLRYGYAHGDVNRVEHFWSLGSQYRGLIPKRDEDVLGFGVAQSVSSRQYRSRIDDRADRETAYELYYAIKVTPWCVVTPDVQVITHPGATTDARDALLGGVRVKIAF